VIRSHGVAGQGRLARSGHPEVIGRNGPSFEGFSRPVAAFLQKPYELSQMQAIGLTVVGSRPPPPQ
jgi:hypothetical protein